MIKLENTEVLGWEATIRGMRNPMNSWDKSDSGWKPAKNYFDDDDVPVTELSGFKIGPSDHKLMMNLAKAGSVDAKYRRMIVVTVDITAPLYWWKEFDTYKIATVANSCSTMHKIHAKEFTLEDFSCEHLLTGEEFGDTAEELWNAGAFHVEHDYDPYALDVEGIEGLYEAEYAKDVLLKTIDALNHYREKFLETKDKRYWWQLIQLLPSSYNQRRTVMLNYEVLAGIYPKRKDHKLDCWHVFCDWIKSLPYSEIITLEEN